MIQIAWENDGLHGVTLRMPSPNLAWTGGKPQKHCSLVIYIFRETSIPDKLLRMESENLGPPLRHHVNFILRPCGFPRRLGQ